MLTAILTYHGLHAPGHDYQTNDHVALEADLRLIEKLGIQIAPLEVIVEHLEFGNHPVLDEMPHVGITFDDGTDHDFLEFYHPEYGYLKSFYTLLREYKYRLQERGDPLSRQRISATSFVIVSPEARSQLDKIIIAGRGQWRDVWWHDAVKSGYFTIANHSWDHNHHVLDTVCHNRSGQGSFAHINEWTSADAEILRAEQFLSQKLGASSGFFAYPYGEANEFLITEYFPGTEHTFRAAFTTAGDFITNNTNRWAIPRFLCGSHWKTESDLQNILSQLVGQVATKCSVN